MRHYSIKRIKDGYQFGCLRCQHRVSTQDFVLSNGNLRTQAAAAINLHHAKEHARRFPFPIALTNFALQSPSRASTDSGYRRPT